MSISKAADRPSAPRRVQRRHLVGALLLAIGLIALVVTIATSSTTTSTSRVNAHPFTINATQSPTAQPTSAPVPSVPGGTFRDPVTHGLLAVDTPAAPQADPGPGHR
jgi:hypothetical protein